MLVHSGRMIVKVPQQDTAKIVDNATGIRVSGYRPEPLFPAFQRTERFGSVERQDHWLLLVPDDAASGESPWDIAHSIASARDYSVYVEPDLLDDSNYVPPEADLEPAVPGMDPHWPPHTRVSPGWHLLAGFTGFESVRNVATGRGTRIALLDTGYWPPHESTPERIRRSLGWNFFEGNGDTTDPGLGGILRQPGHGTATMALLAGNRMRLTYDGSSFSGWVGGAPEAEIVPVRIGASVIHLFTRAMAQGIDHALAPGGNPANRCDVISISMGGLPAASWAAAVNNAFDAGIVIVAASGNHARFGWINIPPNKTVWPSRFDRVVTAVGTTYDKTPYATDKRRRMMGNWGPAATMRKAVAAYTPNVVWMKRGTVGDYDMDGSGTSSATPQIAAACALWLQLNAAHYPEDGSRVIACREALFRTAAPGNGPASRLGRGLLDVPALLAATVAAIPSPIAPIAPDAVRSPLWRQLTAGAEPRDERERMLEVEAAQVFQRSSEQQVADAEARAWADEPLSDAEKSDVLVFLARNPDVSSTLRKAVAVL